MDDRQLIEDLLSALEYHTEQTRPIEFSKVAIEAAREYLRKPAQRTWVGLTDDERDNIWHTIGNSDAHGDVDGWSGRYVMKALEALLKEKNEH